MSILATLGLVVLAAANNVNPGFEDPQGMTVAGWTTDDIDGARWEPWDAGEVRNGKTAMRLRGTGSSRDTRVRLVSDPIPVQYGDAVAFECWIRANGTPRSNLLVFVEGHRNGVWSVLAPVADGPQSDRWLRKDWSPQSYTTFVPQGVDQVRLVCAGGIGLELRVSWYVDDFTATIVSVKSYAEQQKAAGKERLNDIYLVSPDTLSQSALSCYGAQRGYTPDIDWIAKEGRQYFQVTSAAPWTKPSFASIMTSLYPSQHKVEDIHYALPKSAETLAEKLKEKGYLTAAFVWSPYDGYLGPFMQYNQGFDIYFCSDQEDLVTDALKGFLEANQANLSDMDAGGIFIWHHIWEPHTPYINRNARLLANPEGNLGPIDVTDAVVSRGVWGGEGYANAADLRYFHDVYRWEANHTSQIIGEVFARFQWAGLLEKLNVVLCSDHGESFGEKGGVWGHTHGYETCIRTPLLMRFPGRAEPGLRDTETLVSNLDIMPTLLDVAGIDIPEFCQGRSLLQEPKPTDITAKYGISETRRHGFLTVRDGRYKLLLKGASKPLDPSRLDHQWTYCDGSGVYELYDLIADPLELTNLVETQPEVFARLKQALEVHCVQAGIQCGENAGGEKMDISNSTMETLEALGYVGSAPKITSEVVGTDEGFGNLKGQ